MSLARRSCVSPEGRFRYGIHRPSYTVCNLRENDAIRPLGSSDKGKIIDNRANFPLEDVHVEQASTIFEIQNPLPFRGATYITENWAAAKAGKSESIRLPPGQAMSMTDYLRQICPNNQDYGRMQAQLPAAVLRCLAVCSTDPHDLIPLAHLSCAFSFADNGQPNGLRYEENDDGRRRAVLHDHALFEAVANNPHLPDAYKEIMVLRPGAQGGSEIVGEWERPTQNSHIFEYLRRNSYIPWGHYAANMANDAIRYTLADLSLDDMFGLRHLYYQRTFVRMAAQLDLAEPSRRATLSSDALEKLRQQIFAALNGDSTVKNAGFDRTLWGWNYGFDYAPTGYRLHASHQMIHQQFAMIPSSSSSLVAGLDSSDEEPFIPYACGDLVEDFIVRYQAETGTPFFQAYINAIDTNTRMDGRYDLESSLVVWKNQDVMVFVPKAQTSQWELQLMTLHPIGNIFEADAATRASIDTGIFMALRALAGLGAAMVSSIEFSKRIGANNIDQRLLYAFLPKLPESMGAFSEAQLRWINGHFPEDFAAACRNALKDIAV